MASTQLRVAMVGYAFMGAAHSHAWRTAPRFFDLPLAPVRQVICGRDAGKVAAAREKFGWANTETDWRSALTRGDVDLVDICTPGNTHAEIAIAALEAGKHVLCEKPLANSVAEAEAMAAAAQRAAGSGTRAMVGFTYRRLPAIQLARELIGEGEIGTIRQVRAQYLQDWLADENAPLTWHLQKDKAGSGALGDIGAHITDLVQFLTGQRISGVSGLTETFVAERPVAESSSGLTGSAGTERGTVTVDDAAIWLARLSGGAIGTFEATRYAWGRKNALRVEISGSTGTIAFDLERLNELEFFDARQDPRTGGFRRILVTEDSHPYIGAWWPPGHGLGYEHGFTHQVVDLINALAAGEQPEPSFAEGLAVQRVLAAVAESAAGDSTWVSVPG